MNAQRAKQTMEVERLIGLIHGPDCRGLVARAASWIYERGGNILHADQHRDDSMGIFFQRIEWEAASEPAQEAAAFKAHIAQFDMAVDVYRSSRRMKVALFVSKIEHCFLDLLARWRMGELPCELSCVISNHQQLAEVAAFHGLPYHYIPVNAHNKVQAEAQQLAILQPLGIDLIVMARYMQVLSAEFLAQCGCPVINIHHSFLPAFAGAKPYHQAHARGVKLIGATAHYATAVLDDGPIIQQDVSPINHRHAVQDLIRRGRDLEKSVLAQAVRWHLEHRVLVYGNKTVVFD